jgi:hypothetical protein
MHDDTQVYRYSVPTQLSTVSTRRIMHIYIYSIYILYSAYEIIFDTRASYAPFAPTRDRWFSQPVLLVFPLRFAHIPHPRANLAAVPRADSVSTTTAAYAHVWPPPPPTPRPPARLRLPSSCTSVPRGESLLPVPHPPLPCGVRPHLRQLQLPAGARSPSPAAQAACLRPPDSTRQATARGPSPHSLLSSPGRRPFQSDVRLTAICCRFRRL